MSQESGVHTSLHRVELLLGDLARPGDFAKLSKAQATEVHETLSAFAFERPNAPLGDCFCIGERFSKSTDLLAQLLLYFPVVGIPDPLASFVEFGPEFVSPTDIDRALREHRKLDELASAGVVRYFWPLEDESHQAVFEAQAMIADPTVAKAILGELSVDDAAWIQEHFDAPDLKDQEYMNWRAERPDLEAERELASGTLATMLPTVLGVRRAGSRLLPTTARERVFALDIPREVASKMETGTVEFLLGHPVPCLDGLAVGDAVNLRQDAATWGGWQTALRRVVFNSSAYAADDPQLAEELLSDALREWSETLEGSRFDVAKRVALEGSFMDVLAAFLAFIVTGNPLSALPSATKALGAPAYRSAIKKRPTGPDAVLLALRS